MCECIEKMGKLFLLVLNGIFLLLGLSFFLIGIMLLANVGLFSSEVKPLLDNIKFNNMSLGDAMVYLPVTCLILGLFISIIAFLGFCGALKRKRVVLVIYAVIIAIFLVLEIAIVVMFIVFKDKLDTELKSEMTVHIQTHYKHDDLTSDEQSTAWNVLCLENECCGVESTSASSNVWKDSPWKTSSGTNNIPKGCCTGVTKDNYNTFTDATCTDNVASNYHTKGCYEVLTDKFTKYFVSAPLIGGLIVGVEVLAFVFSCLLCCRYKEQNKVY